MAIQQLNEEQIKSWSREQKDQWWLQNVYQGEMPQLTFRSALTGFLLGGILAATALYIAGKTGVNMGVGLTSVILAFALFRILSRTGLCKDFTVLENNCTQSIATAAGYMTMPMVAPLTAYMLVTGKIIPWQHMLIWMTICSILGVLVAFPLKRRFINEDQLPFPEGRACGVVLDSLYSDDGNKGMRQARLLGVTALWAGAYQFIISDGWMKLLQFKILQMDKWAGLKEVWYLHERFDHYYYLAAEKFQLWVPKILGTDLRVLGLRWTVDAAMFGVGGLMGFRVASSLVLGTLLNYAVLAPMMIKAGDIAERIAPNGKVVAVSRVEILNQWGLWWAVAIMVVGSIISLAAKPEIFLNMFKMFGRKKPEQKQIDVLAQIEFPLILSYIGIPIFAVLAAYLNNSFFGVSFVLSLASLPLVFILAVIAANSMALTSWIPSGALSKITQFSMGAIDRVNPSSNIIPAGLTAEVASNASSLLSDIKAGYMLGAKPRQQALGHVIGIVAGAMACIPIYYLLFLPADANGVRDTATIVSERFSHPSAMQWKGLAELIARGVSSLPGSAIIAMIVAAIAGVIIEGGKLIIKDKMPLSAVAIGLGVVLPPESCIAMWVGAAVFWWMGRKNSTPGTKGYELWVEGCEPICAGLITGAALVGIGNAIMNAVL